MADTPDYIVLKTHRDMDGRDKDIWFRRGILTLLGLVPLLALFNVFGQRPAKATADSSAASLQLYAPTHLRGGLLYEARIHIEAHQDVKDARVLLDSGWAEGMTINTIEPSPVGEASTNGSLSFDLGHVPKGRSYLLFLQFQVNPTNVGRRSQDLSLYDGDTKLTSINRTVTIFP